MDLNGIEHIDFNALGGADNVTVGDLTGTGVTQVAIDLSGAAGSGVGDGAADSVTVNGTAGNDNVQVAGTGGSVSVSGLAATVTLAGVEGANDQLDRQRRCRQRRHQRRRSGGRKCATDHRRRCR